MARRQILADSLRDFYLRTHRLLDGAMREQGASYARTRLLALIDLKGSARSTDIGVALAYAPRTVTLAIDALEREGLVSRRPDPGDRRVKHVVLTDAGRAVLGNAEPIRQAFLDRAFDALDDGEAATLAALMGKLNARLEAMVKDAARTG